MATEEGGRERERRKSWFSMTCGRDGSGTVPEMWDKPLWRGVGPYLDPWESGWTRALHPSRISESMCLDRSPHDGWGECPSDGDSSPELRHMWKYGCPKSPVWSSGGDECAGSEGTSSFEDYKHNVDNLALEAFLSTWTGCDFWGEGCVGRNGVTVNGVNELECLILRFFLQFEHGVPSSEWGCSFCSFVCLLVLCKVQEVERRPYHISGAFGQQSEGWFSWLSMCARGKETPKLFMVRAFHLLVSLTGTGDGCFLLEPRSFDSKSFENQKTEWLTRNDEVWEWKMNTDGETVVFLHIVRLKRCAENCRGATDSVHCRVWCNDKFSQFRVFKNYGVCKMQ